MKSRFRLKTMLKIIIIVLGVTVTIFSISDIIEDGLSFGRILYLACSILFILYILFADDMLD